MTLNSKVDTVTTIVVVAQLPGPQVHGSSERFRGGSWLAGLEVFTAVVVGTVKVEGVLKVLASEIRVLLSTIPASV